MQQCRLNPGVERDRVQLLKLYMIHRLQHLLSTAFNLRPYVLDCANPEHQAIGKEICAQAAKLPWQAVCNLIIAGRRPRTAGPFTIPYVIVSA